MPCSRRVTRRYSDRDLANTLVTAERRYELWTSEDLGTVLAVRDDGRWVLSAREAAQAVGRTAGAVQAQRSAYRKAQSTP